MLAYKDLPFSAIALFVVTLLVSGALPASAQTPFSAAQSWWTGPGGTLGVSTDGVTLFYDVDGNGAVNDPWDTEHPLPAAAVGGNLRLTPTRRVLYVFKSGCTDTEVLFYTIPSVDNDPLAIIAGPICIPNGIAHEGFYYSAATSARWAYVADRVPAAGTTQQIYWVDLNSGANAASQFPLNENVGTVTFDSLGIAAFVQHDTNDGDNLADYSIVELCAGSIGTIVNAGGGGLSQLGPDVAQAFLVDNAGSPEARIEHPPGSFLAQFALNDCSTAPTLGACCQAAGGCADGVSEADCLAGSGTWNGAGSDCATAGCPPPPFVQPEISKSGPATAREGDLITYTIDYGNTGNADASTATIVDFVPGGTSFVSATGGGVFNGFNRVTWALGSLGAGSSGSVTFTVQVSCGQTSVTNASYWIDATPGGQVFGAAVVTNITSALNDTIQVTVTSVPQAPEPLGTGDLIEHTITLTNPAAENRPSLSMGISYGQAAEFGSVIDHGGGVLLPFPASASWTGDLGPSATINIVFTTKVKECRGPLELSTQLNLGSPIDVRGTCGVIVIGRAPAPAAFAIEPPPIAMSLTPTNLQSPQVLSDVNRLELLTLARAGDVVELEGKVVNTTGAPSGTVTASFVIPGGMTPDGNPPYIGTPPAGTSYDSGTQTVSWTGSIPANDSVVVAFGAFADSGGTCIAELDYQGSYGSCSSRSFGLLHIAEVGLPPAESYLLGVSDMLGVWTFRPGIDTSPQVLLCADFSVFDEANGLDRDDNGDIWISGSPALRFNPVTLGFRLFAKSSFADSLGMNRIDDVAIDASDSTVVFLGQQQVSGSNTLVVTRYDPGDGTITNILSGPPLPPFVDEGHILFDAEGHLAATTEGGVIRIDPASPGGSPIYSDASVAQPLSLCIDTDGEYLVTDDLWGSGTPLPLMKIDRMTGTFATEFADLHSIFPWDDPFVGSVVGPDGTIYMAARFGPVMKVERPGWTAATLGSFGLFTRHHDLEWVDNGVVSVGPGAAPAVPMRLHLAPARPNPFSARTTIRYALPRPGHVRLAIYDVRGRRVADLVNDVQQAGPHEVRWEARGSGRVFASGVYFLRIDTGGQAVTRKVVLAR